MRDFTRTFRPLTTADVPSLLELFGQAGLSPNAAPAELQWKYWQPRADWPGPRAFVITDARGPVSHGALIPGWCAWGDRRIRLVHVIDWVARAGSHGAGVELMKHVGQLGQALLAVGGSAQTLQILPRVGFRPMGCVTGYVRTLHPLRLLKGGGLSSGWRIVPRIARSFAWALRAPGTHSAGWLARRIGADEVSSIAGVLPVPARGMAVLERSAASLSYVLSCPVVPMALFALEQAGRVRGYFLLACAPGQVRIADCWVDSDEPADWRAMILCAVEQARRDRQAAEVVIWANDALLAQVLPSCGFHARLEVPIQLRPADASCMPPLPLRVQMLDCDAAYLHEGHRTHWA
jgi:hypothetical protein